jgi:SAM-dependent methyltransferase
VTSLERLEREYGSSRSLAARLADIRPPRNPRAEIGLNRVVRECPAPRISIGGGPLRAHPTFWNLNLAPFPNVDVVGDAHRLPLLSSGVGAIHCEAVLEHLEDPEVAVAEMFRVLMPGGLVFAATPFLQVFHGYPDHYRNFTLSGHRRLFVSSGFEILDSGACVGPAFALVDVASNLLREYVPTRVLSRLSWLVTRLVGRAVVQLDRLFLRSPASHVVASTTFVLARKPVAETRRPDS